MNTLTDREYELLHHAVGAPKHRAECSVLWRAYFCADNGSDDWTTCKSLADKGLMRIGHNLGRSTFFHVTAEGVSTVSDRLPEFRCWDVETESGMLWVYSATRSKARAEVVRSVASVCNVPWREALAQIRSVRLAHGAGKVRR